jgi:fructose-1,6-bisphosphatase II / sedoheptulose-1,7-bisphosphatase
MGDIAPTSQTAVAGALASCLGEQLSRATEFAAIAASAEIGRGDEEAADTAAARAMSIALSTLNLRGRIVVGERQSGEAGLDVGIEVGRGSGPQFDIALDALEGSTLTAKSQPNALSVIAATPRGGMLPAPDIYMDKLAVGPGLPQDVVDLDAPAGDNALRLAKARGVDVREIVVCVLDRPRHDKIIADLRRVGARVRLISDGDVAAVIQTSLPEMGIDMYVGQGGAPEGVLAAAAMRCVGGQFQARLAIRNEAERRLAIEAGFQDPKRRYMLNEIVSGDTVFAATGVTRGALLDGAKLARGRVLTSSLVMSSIDGVIRRIQSSLPASAARAANA